MKFFNKTKKNMTLTQKFDYIKEHFTYCTMNSWNKTESIANNIKLYKLPLTKEQKERAWEIIGDENLNDELWWNELEPYIAEFKDRYHQNYDIYSNGRNGGYLVLTGNNGYKVVNEDIKNAESYKKLIKNFQDYYGWSFREAQKEARQEIEDTFDLIVDFDETCDDMLAEFIYVLDNFEITTKTYTKECEYKTFNIDE